MILFLVHGEVHVTGPNDLVRVDKFTKLVEAEHQHEAEVLVKDHYYNLSTYNTNYKVEWCTAEEIIRKEK